MTDTRIVHLNHYCLVEILNQIKRNCEVNKIPVLNIYTKYDDLISFALTSEDFRYLLRECYPNLYDRLEIEQTHLMKLDHVFMDFDRHYKELQKASQKDQDLFWKIYMKCLQLNAQVSYVQLIYCREIYNRDHIEILDMFMSAIQNKRSIKRLYIDMEGCSLDRLAQLRHLESLDVKAKMDASDLADHCEANQSLVSLTLRSNDIYGKLTDIVPHCKNLQYLTFMVKEDFNDSEYTQLAKLPSLKYLNILGAHESGSLCPLLKSLATKGPSTLKELNIYAAPMDTAEILEACRIESLAEFTCKFFNVKDFYLRILGNVPKDLYLYFGNGIDATDLAILLNLTEFTSLRISGRHKAGTLKPFFKAIADKESPKLQILRIENDEEDQSAIMFNNNEILEVFKIKSLKTLQCGYFDGLFKGLAQQTNSKLDNLTIRGSPMSSEDLMEIPKIERLKNLTCGLVDVNTMYHLAQLTQLKVLTITSGHPRHEFSEAVLRFYEASKRNVSIYSKGNWVKEKTPYINTTELIPQDYLSIYGRYPHDPLTSLFKTFASSKSTVPQELFIKNNTSPIEVRDVAQLKTLRYITCEFTDSQSLQHLKHLPELESLITTSSQNFPDIDDGFLSRLMGSSNETRVNRDDKMIFNKNLLQLRSLHIIGRHKLEKKILKNLENVVKALALNNKQSLTEFYYKTKVESEETLELSQIASLKTLKCGFSDVKCVELLIKLTYLQELIITRYPEGFLKGFLQELAARELSYLQSPSLSDNLPISENIAKFARKRFLKRLDCALEDEDYIHILAKFSQLEELTIRDNKCDSLATLFHPLLLLESKSLQHLSITDRSISYEEMTMVAKIKTLREICCTLNDKESIKLLDQLPELTKLSIGLYEYDGEGIEILAQLNKLTHLKIKSPKSGSLTGLLNQLSSRADPILQSLIINGIDLDSTEIDAIAQLKTLRRLQCGFEEDNFYECLSYLTNLEVLKITSKLDLSDNSQTLLTILQKCHKLKVIEIQDGDGFVPLEFMSEALKILKTVRNPQIQEALQLVIRHFKCLTSEQKRFPADNFAEWNNGHPLGLRTVHAYVLVYDMGNLESFQYCRSIRDQILDSFSHRDFSIIVVGNKYDNVTEAQANSQELKDISTLVRKHWRCGYVECSAQYNYKIGDVFRELMGCSSGGVTGTTGGGLVGTDYSQSTRNKGRCTIL